MGETIKDVVVKIRLEADAAALRKAADEARGAGGGGGRSGGSGGGAGGQSQFEKDFPKLAEVEKRHAEENAKAAALKTRMIVRYNQIEAEGRRERFASFVREKKEEEQLEKIKSRRAQAEAQAARQSMADSRNQVERVGRLAEGIGNLARSFTFLGASASESLQKAVQGIMVVEGAIRGVQGALQVGQVAREFLSMRGGAGRGQLQRGGGGSQLRGGVIRGRGLAGSLIGDDNAEMAAMLVGQGGITGAGMVGGLASAGSTIATGAISAAASPFAAAAAIPLAIAGGVYAYDQLGHNRRVQEQEGAIVGIQRNRRATANFGGATAFDQFAENQRRRAVRGGRMFNQERGSNSAQQLNDPELTANWTRDMDARDIAEFNAKRRAAANPELDVRMAQAGTRFESRMNRDMVFAGRKSTLIRGGSINALRKEQDGVSGQFNEDQSAGMGTDNLDKQAMLQGKILGLMRDQLRTAKDLRGEASQRMLAAQSAVTNEEERRKGLKSFIGGLDPGRRSVLERLNAKVASGKALTQAEEMQLAEVAGGHADSRIAAGRAARVTDPMLEKVGSHLFDIDPDKRGGGQIGGQRDELAKLREDQARAREEQVKAFQKAAAASEKETLEVTRLVELMTKAAQLRALEFEKQNVAEAKAQADARARASNKQAAP